MVRVMTTMLCHGCFDVLHIGHVRFLTAAKGLGDHLIVSVTADAFVTKGRGRPIFTAEERGEMLEALSVVDQVYIAYAASALPIIEHLRPDLYVKGGDYVGGDVLGYLDEERAAVEAYGGRLVILDVPPRYSSTALVNGSLLLARSQAHGCRQSV